MTSRPKSQCFEMADTLQYASSCWSPCFSPTSALVPDLYSGQTDGKNWMEWNNIHFWRCWPLPHSTVSLNVRPGSTNQILHLYLISKLTLVSHPRPLWSGVFSGLPVWPQYPSLLWRWHQGLGGGSGRQQMLKYCCINSYPGSWIDAFCDPLNAVSC